MPDQAKPLVSALVVSYNAKDLLLQCLQAFFANSDVPVEAVVVDNDSSDGSAAAVTDEFPQATVLAQPKNVGYGRAANLGPRALPGPLRSPPRLRRDRRRRVRRQDGRLLAHTPRRGRRRTETRSSGRPRGPRRTWAFPMPRTMLYRTVGLSKLFPKSPRFGRYNMGHLPDTDAHEMDAGSGACLMVRMAALERVGFFDPPLLHVWRGRRPVLPAQARRMEDLLPAGSRRHTPRQAGHPGCGAADVVSSATGRCGPITSSTTPKTSRLSGTAWCGRRSGVAGRPSGSGTPSQGRSASLVK